MRLLADEHVKRVFITELRANGYDVVWVDDGYDPGTPDSVHLEQSKKSGRTILSNDVDFARGHEEYAHGGIILYHDQNMSVTAFISGIKRIERFVPDAELRGSLVWLDEWTG